MTFKSANIFTLEPLVECFSITVCTCVYEDVFKETIGVDLCIIFVSDFILLPQGAISIHGIALVVRYRTKQVKKIASVVEEGSVAEAVFRYIF